MHLAQAALCSQVYLSKVPVGKVQSRLGLATLPEAGPALRVDIS